MKLIENLDVWSNYTVWLEKEFNVNNIVHLAEPDKYPCYVFTHVLSMDTFNEYVYNMFIYLENAQEMYNTLYSEHTKLSYG